MEINSYLKAAFAIACLAAGFISGCTYKQRELDRIKLDYSEQVQAGLQANRELEKRMNDNINVIANQYEAQKSVSDRTIESLRKELANVKKTHPLPDNCRLGNERMRIIKDAIDNANNP